MLASTLTLCVHRLLVFLFRAKLYVKGSTSFQFFAHFQEGQLVEVNGNSN